MRKIELIELLVSDFKMYSDRVDRETIALLKSKLFKLDVSELELLSKQIPFCIVFDRSKQNLPNFYQAVPDLKTAYKHLKGCTTPFQIITMR